MSIGTAKCYIKSSVLEADTVLAGMSENRTQRTNFFVPTVLKIVVALNTQELTGITAI